MVTCDFVFSQDFCSAVTVVYNIPYIVCQCCLFALDGRLSFMKEISIKNLSFKHTVAHVVPNFQLALL